MSASRRVVVLTVAAAFAAFCIVQDRVTAAGARRYVALQQEALADGGPLLTIDLVMRPAVARSVREGLLWANLVLAVGLSLAAGIASPPRALARWRERRAGAGRPA